MLYDLHFFSRFRRSSSPLIFCLLLLSCKTKLSDNTINDWNSGKIVIATDENLQDITQQLVEIYEHENEKAKVVLKYEPQDQIIHEFVTGEIKSMIISRNLETNEIELANQNQKIKTQEVTFAYNAVALIANKNFKDSVIEISAIKNYLQPVSPVKIIFDNKQSGIPKFIMEKTGIDASLLKSALVTANADDVIEYVHRDNNAIGFISFNLISNIYEQRTKEILSQVKILDIKTDSTVEQISQESIYNFSYPLQQPINLVLGNNPELVGRGFSNFLCREKAAKILLKSGLVPRFMPTRKVTVHDELKTN